MSRRSVAIGAASAAGLALVYSAVLWTTSGMAHLVEQTAADWYWLALLLAGFGTQAGLLAELRHRHRTLSATTRAGTAGGVTGSTVGMVACCAHHLAELLPFVAAAGVATFLTDYRTPVLVFGVAASAVGVVLALRRLGRLEPAPHTGDHACAA